MAAAGWAIAETASTSGGKPFVVAVVNDRHDAVKVMPCGRYECGQPSVVLASHQRRVWHSQDNDTGVQFFFVLGSDDRVLGCLGQTDLAGEQARYLTSTLQECLT